MQNRLGNRYSRAVGEYRIFVVDYNADTATLLARTLQRRFPTSHLSIWPDSEKAVAAVKAGVDVVVIHRTFEHSAASLAKIVRRLTPNCAIICVSSIDRSEHVLAAGADGFINLEEWLRLGQVVETVLALKQSQRSEVSDKSPTS